MAIIVIGNFPPKGDQESGFTLVEIMMVVAIVGIVASLAPRLMVDTTRFTRTSMAKYEIQRDSKNAITVINRNLRQAKNASIAISSLSGQLPYSRITFDKYVSDTSVKPMSFYQQGTSLYVMDNGSTNTLCGNVRYLAFTFPRTDDVDILAVSLSLEKGTYQGRTKTQQMAVEKVRVMN